MSLQGVLHLSKRSSNEGTVQVGSSGTSLLQCYTVMQTYHSWNLSDKFSSTLNMLLQGVLHLSKRSSNEGTVKWHYPPALYHCGVTVSRFGSH